MGDRAGDTPTTGLAIYSPWDDVGERLGDWIIEHVSLEGLHEVMCWRRRVILLEADRTVVQRRSDLAHAIAHVDLGHHAALDTKSEHAAERLAAKRMIHCSDLADALRWTGGRISDEAAEMLNVDLPLLRVRLECLHPAERGYLRRNIFADA